MPDWYRTCQECGNEQVAKPPSQSKELTTSYRDSKCRKCKSMALDYGKYRLPEEDWSE